MSVVTAGTIHPTRFMVGPLAYLLKNRFYIGEVVYRDEVHPGEQQPSISRRWSLYLDYTAAAGDLRGPAQNLLIEPSRPSAIGSGRDEFAESART